MKVKVKLKVEIKGKVWNEDPDMLWVAADLIELPVWQMHLTMGMVICTDIFVSVQLSVSG